MSDLAKNLRRRIIETLELIADAEKQRCYQLQVPHVDVPAELFNQWEDCYPPDGAAFLEAFAVTERMAINDFHNVYQAVADATPRQLPPLEEFILTEWWEKLSRAAGGALEELHPRR